ncbi:MAG: BrnA antitoxin family protein [Pyrinomonadaceae bacterium]
MSKKHTTKTYGTDIQRLRNMADDEIDFSDIPRTTPEFWAKGIVRKGLKPVVRKRQVTLRIDSDIIDYLRAGGDGYQTRINQLLRSFVDADKAAHAK